MLLQVADVAHHQQGRDDGHERDGVEGVDPADPAPRDHEARERWPEHLGGLLHDRVQADRVRQVGSRHEHGHERLPRGQVERADRRRERVGQRCGRRAVGVVVQRRRQRAEQARKAPRKTFARSQSTKLIVGADAASDGDILARSVRLQRCAVGVRIDRPLRLRRECMIDEGLDIRFKGKRIHLDLPDLTNGKLVHIYGQQEVVKDLIAARLKTGGALLFEAEATRIEGAKSDKPTIHFTHEGKAQTLTCDIIAGCDGFHGIGRQAIPASELQVFDREFPFSWLGILSESPPLKEMTYCNHDRGYALVFDARGKLVKDAAQVKVGDEITAWASKMGVAPSREQKAARKAQVATVPTASGRQAAPVEDEESDAPADVIARIAKQRAQARPVSYNLRGS